MVSSRTESAPAETTYDRRNRRDASCGNDTLENVATANQSYASFEATSLRMVHSAAWIDIYAITALMFTAASRMESSPAPFRGLSDAACPVYLLHLSFVYEVIRLLPGPVPRIQPLDVAFTVATGLTGSLAVIFLGRKLLGRYSRDVIGA